MKKRIPYIVALAWMVAVAALAFADGYGWSRERARSAYLDGCVEGDRIYLVENMERDAVLYVMDSEGAVREVSLASVVDEGSFFAKIDYEDALYGLLVRKGALEEEPLQYRIVQFDDQGRMMGKTAEFTLQQEGTLTGFHAEPRGFYLTVVPEDQASAAAYFVEKEELGSQDAESAEETAEKTVLSVKKPVSMGYSPSGRALIEARYENGEFLYHLDDGSGVESFQAGEKLQAAFWYRSLSVGQLLKVRRERMLLYGAFLIVGYGVLWLFLSVLRNRSHTVYAIAVVELALFFITLAGAVQVPRIQEKAREEEAERFGCYYVRALAEEIGDPARLHLEEKDFYQGTDYETLRAQLSRFVRHDDISRIFVDMCLVRSDDHRILASVSGRNGQIFEEVYGVGTGELLRDLTENGRESSMLIGINGEPYQVIGAAASEGLYPEYVLAGIARREDGRVSVESRVSPFLYSAGVFLAGSVVSIWLLLLQGRELKKLAGAMQLLANGETQIKKGTVHGKDVDFMWNSLMEIRKTISRINYAKYQIFESCYRFAPKNIEKILGKDSITEVASGDMVLLHGTMAVISSAAGADKGSALAEEISGFVSLMEEHQERSGGFFVSGHCGLDMMKVLFLEESRETTAFGTALMQDYAKRNKERPGRKKAGILLHYSQYIYGVAGTKKHSLPYLLSGEMEELERYAGWFRSLNLPLVITESVRNRENLEGPLRYLGYLLISATSERIRVYEVLDACPLREGKRKAQTDPKFQKGIELFYQHDFYLARNTFNEVLRENPEDSMATWYLFTCEKYLNEIQVKGDVCRLCPELSGTEA